MEGPADIFREKTTGHLREITASGDEAGLASVLLEIENAIESDIDHANLREEDANAVFAAVTSWAALSSDVIAGFYGPHRSVGWAPLVTDGILRIGRRLRRPLGHAARGLGASGYTIGSGSTQTAIAVTLMWRIPPPPP